MQYLDVRIMENMHILIDVKYECNWGNILKNILYFSFLSPCIYFSSTALRTHMTDGGDEFIGLLQ